MNKPAVGILVKNFRIQFRGQLVSGTTFLKYEHREFVCYKVNPWVPTTDFFINIGRHRAWSFTGVRTISQAGQSFSIELSAALMHLVITKVKLKQDSVEDCVRLFKETNPTPVQSEPDWLGAKMVVDRESDVVTVMAVWRNAASYEALAKSEHFKTTMSGFAQLFASPPENSTDQCISRPSR
ncbi:MAG: putative quinol monooxygenase [Rhizobiaceae bacterium]